MKQAATLLVVKNLIESKRFYEERLGLKLISEHSGRLHFEFGGHLIVMFQGESVAPVYKHGFDSSSSLVFSVDNLDKKIKELKSYGVTFVHKTPNQNSWGRYSAFSDPSGIIHELIELA